MQACDECRYYIDFEDSDFKVIYDADGRTLYLCEYCKGEDV